MLRLTSILIVSVLWFLSCAGTQRNTSVPGQDEHTGDSRRDYVEDFDPLTLDDDDITIHPTLKETQTSKEPAKPIEDSTVVLSDVDEGEMVQGYRVQLLATVNAEEAREARKEAIFKFTQVDVYLELDGSLYKLRIGDCKAKQQAETLREEALRKGFSDAWIVPSRIYRQR